jgi:hypothetical protein
MLVIAYAGFRTLATAVLSCDGEVTANFTAQRTHESNVF